MLGDDGDDPVHRIGDGRTDTAADDLATFAYVGTDNVACETRPVALWGAGRFTGGDVRRFGWNGFMATPDGGTLVLDPSWKGVDFSKILPSSWQIVFDGEEQDGFLTFTNMNKSSDEIGLMYDGELMPKAWPVIEYSFDAQKWMSLEINSRIEVPMGGRIYFRGKNPKGLSASDSAYFRFASKGKYAVSGDVMSLIDYEKRVTEIPCEFCFAHLFENMSITTAPTLSATTLKDCCYYRMFSGATSPDHL